MKTEYCIVEYTKENEFIAIIAIIAGLGKNKIH